MLEILNRITGGEGEESDIALLEELAEFMEAASLCALGRTAAYPVMSTLKHFRAEYDAHIRNKECKAGVCKALVSYHINPAKCIGCAACVKDCPTNAIAKTTSKLCVINEDQCIKCGACMAACPPKVKAVELIANKSVHPGKGASRTEARRKELVK
jgi:ferredoxin